MGVLPLKSAVRDRRRADHARELRVLAQASLRAWDRVLWLSCGNGWGPEEAWRRMRKGYVCGLERSPEQVGQAHQLRAVPHTLEFRRWDGCTVPCPAQSFDHVISCAAILASPHPEGLVQEISRILVTRGTLTLVETTEIASDGRAAITTASQLLAMLVNAGFTQADCVKDGDGWLTGSARQRARARLTNPRLIAATVADCEPSDDRFAIHTRIARFLRRESTATAGPSPRNSFMPIADACENGSAYST